jgi:hypothetical protein
METKTTYWPRLHISQANLIIAATQEIAERLDVTFDWSQYLFPDNLIITSTVYRPDPDDDNRTYSILFYTVDDNRTVIARARCTCGGRLHTFWEKVEAAWGYPEDEWDDEHKLLPNEGCGLGAEIWMAVLDHDDRRPDATEPEPDIAKETE